MEERIMFYDMKDNLILDTYGDYSLLVQEITIPEAVVKEEIEEIPGSDEILDYSESLDGDVHYQRRVIQIELASYKQYNEFLNIYSRLQNSIHGRKVKMIFSKEPNFYWTGRVSVGDYSVYATTINIIINVTVDPYKYDLQNSIEDWLWDPFSFENGIIYDCKDLLINGKLEIVMIGRRKHITPIFYVEGNISVTHNNVKYLLEEGNNEVLDIEIVEGENRFMFEGNGKVDIIYRGGSL